MLELSLPTFLGSLCCSSESILEYITKFIFCESNTIWKTLSQNADVTKTIPLTERKKKFLIYVKLKF